MSKINIFALGGLNEVGKNMYVVKVDEEIYIFDAGMKFNVENAYGVDYILPDFNYLKENISQEIFNEFQESEHNDLEDFLNEYYIDELEKIEHRWKVETMTYEDYLREFEPNSIELDEDGNYIGD